MRKPILLEPGSNRPLWLDVIAPSQEELMAVGREYGLHDTAVEDCMDAMHLPKHEKMGETTFLIVRAFDPDAKPFEDHVQAMTRKLALFLGNRFLLTIHRCPEPYVEEVAQRYAASKDPVVLQVVLIELLLGAVETYYKPLEQAELTLQKLEQSIHASRLPPTRRLEEAFHLKNRLMAIKRMLWHSLNTVQKFVPFSAVNMPHCQDLKERIENLSFFADSLLDDLNNLLNLQIALSAQGTNEVIRVLTLFSVYFLPLNFIVGLYGMNFRHMPELEHRWGYPAVLALLVSVSLGIFLWFRRRRWM